MAKRKKNTHPAKQKFAQNSMKPVEKINPFELKINRKKYDIIGQRTKARFGSKNANKAKSNEKRRDFFKKIHLHRNKANNFIDKRIGEYDSEMVNEDRILAHIAEEGRKQHKKSLYNLNDEFDLTHGGQPISNLDAVDDHLEDTDEEDESGLDADFVSEAHFGGFLTKKDSSAPKTRREILNDFIAESKKKKQERQESKEMTDDLTDQLDKEWKQFDSLLPRKYVEKSEDGEKKKEYDPFDMMVAQLKDDPRPRATPVVDRKDETLENQQNMKKLDDEKVPRMRGDVMKPKRSSASVEAIEEDFEKPSKGSKEKENGELNENSIDPAFKANKPSNSDVNLENCILGESFVPQSVEALQDLLSDLSPVEISVKLNSFVSKCRFKNNNMESSKNFFRVLLDYIDVIFKHNLDNIELFEVVARHVYALAQKSALDSGNVFRIFLFEKIAFYNEVKQKKNFAFFNLLIHLKLCGSVYSTSDFHHPICTPAMILMSDILNSPAHVTIPNIACRIFICNLMFDYVSYSKRFVPEAVNYLFSVLVLASSRESSLFNCINKSNLRILIAKKILEVKSSTENWEPVDVPLKWLKIVCCSQEHENGEILLTIVYRVISLLYHFAKLYKHLPIFTELFRPASTLPSYLPTEFYPLTLVTLIEELKSFVTEEKPMEHLSISNEKPKMLPLFTPKYGDFVGKKPSSILDKLKVRKELTKKIKREERGVIRELRRDAEFLAHEQLQEKMEADTQRKRKVKELYSELAVQAGEYNKFSKKQK